MELGTLLPLLTIPLTLAWVLYNRQRLSKAKAAHADKLAFRVAERLGMAVVEGDPNLNLAFFEQPRGDYERTLRLRGRPYGRFAEFWVRDSRRTAEYIVASNVTTSFASRLELSVPGTAVFEVVLRDPNQYLTLGQEYAELPLGEVYTGVLALDRQFIVRAENPAVGPALVPALELLASHHYVHLAGGPQRIWMKVERMGLGYLAASPEEYLLALESAACGLEGRPAPAALPPHPVPHSGVA